MEEALNGLEARLIHGVEQKENTIMHVDGRNW
jgi:hypothetical protein